MDNNHQMNALNRDNTQFQNDLPLDIASLIQIVRGRPVMIDRDLAMLYGVETKRLNETLKGFRRTLCSSWIHMNLTIGSRKLRLPIQ